MNYKMLYEDKIPKYELFVLNIKIMDDNDDWICVVQN